jgi:hypothetical protein
MNFNVFYPHFSLADTYTDVEFGEAAMDDVAEK